MSLLQNQSDHLLSLMYEYILLYNKQNNKQYALVNSVRTSILIAFINH